MDGHYADITVKSDVVNAPTQQYGESFTTNHPCAGFQKSYSGLLGWWIDLAGCEGYNDADFCNMLVTAATTDTGEPYIGGGVTDNDNFAVAITGIKAAQVPSSYQDYGMGGEFKAVRTAHHELGHMMMGDVDNSHNFGETFEHNTSDHYMTPMYVQVPNGYNTCNKAQSLQGNRGWEQKWSGCCEAEW